MSMQVAGPDKTLPTGAAAPTLAGDGLAMTEFSEGSPSYQPSDYRLKVVLTGTGAVETGLVLWGYDGTHWGLMGESGGALNDGAAVSGSDSVVVYFMLKNLGLMQRLYLQTTGLTGTGAAVAATLCRAHNFKE